MAEGGLTKTRDDIGKALLGILDRGRSPSAYLSRVVWPQFQQAQIERFESENQSQSGNTVGGQALGQWPALNPTYAKQKRKRFASYPGGGGAMMVATSRLSSGAQGQDTAYFGRTIEDSAITVAINITALPYAVYPAKTRPFMSFNAQTIEGWTKGIADYVLRGKE